MNSEVRIEDVAIWLKHLDSPHLINKLEQLDSGQEITLETDGVIGRWQKMKTGKDGRKTRGIRPIGSMKLVWADWFKHRKGEQIEIRVVKMADDYLAASSVLFSEWSDDEDEEAFRDL